MNWLILMSRLDLNYGNMIRSSFLKVTWQIDSPSRWRLKEMKMNE